MPLGPDDVRARAARSRSSPAPPSASAEAIALAFANFGADVAVCDRDAHNLGATADEIEAAGRRVVAGRARRARRATQVDRFAGRRPRPVRPRRHPREQRRRRVPRRLPRRQRQGPGRARPRELHQRRRFIRGVVPLMPATGGSIINITSIEAHRAAPGFAIYSSMKAAVANLTESLALELGPRLIRVNCIAPDVIPTPGIGAARVQVRRRCRAGATSTTSRPPSSSSAATLSKFVTGTTHPRRRREQGGRRLAPPTRPAPGRT